MIEFDKVSKSFGRTKVLDDVSLKIKHGEFVSIVGPSGAGKSTLVYALIGAEKLSKGSITVDGYEVSKMKGRALQFFRRRVGVVFQDFKLLRKKTLFENVAFALEVCGFDQEEIHARVNAALALVGLSRKNKQYPHQLSGGEKQRASIARALVHNPGLIIADEPTGNLDPQTARDIIDLLVRINEEGTTVILTTHNKDLVNYIKKRVVRLEDGKVKSDKQSAGYHS